VASLDDAELAAIRFYTTNSFHLNRALRTGSFEDALEAPQKITAAIDGLERALDRARLPHTTTVRRGVVLDGMPADLAKQYRTPGAVIEDLGFVSTATRRSAATQYLDFDDPEAPAAICSRSSCPRGRAPPTCALPPTTRARASWCCSAAPGSR
jgi:ADP-ribosyltransferase exoenzyme